MFGFMVKVCIIIFKWIRISKSFNLDSEMNLLDDKWIFILSFSIMFFKNDISLNGRLFDDSDD